MWRCFPAFLAMVSFCTLASAENPLAEGVDSWVPKLASPRFSERETAARELAKAGSLARTALLSASVSNDPELRVRARSVLEEIDRVQLMTSLLSTRTISLNYIDAPLATVVDDLKKQTGIPIKLLEGGVADPMRRITLIQKDVAYWKAIEMLCEVAGLREDYRAELPLPSPSSSPATSYYQNAYSRSNNPLPTMTPSTAPILLVDGTGESAPGNRDGRVRVLVLGGRFPTNKLIRGTGRILLTLDVAADPKLNWEEATRVRVTRAEDEEGRPVFPDLLTTGDDPSAINASLGGQIMFGGGQAFFVDSNEVRAIAAGNMVLPNPRLVTVALKTQDRDIRMLRRLEGFVQGEIHQPNMPVITIENVTHDQPQTRNNADVSTLTVSGFKTDADGATRLRVRIEMFHPDMTQKIVMGRRGFARQFDNSINNAINQLKFYDAAGKICGTPSQMNSHFSWTNRGQTLDTELRFSKSSSYGPPRSVVQLGTKVSTVEVPFKVLNVKLP